MAKSIDDIVIEHGWSTEDQLELLWAFLNERKLVRKARDFFATVADRQIATVQEG